MTPERRLLAIYLDDHRAAGAAGRALARRIELRYGDETGFEELADIRRAIDEDLRSLERVRDGLGVEGGRLKRALALVGERLGRLKLNGRLVRRSPLSRLIELEMLAAGVSAKARLWDALMAACGSDQVVEVDLRHLRERADDQLERIRRMHGLAARPIDCPPG